MIKILCPTDFSVHSKKALWSAVDLATILDAKIVLLNVFKERKVAGAFRSIANYIKKSHYDELQKLKTEIQDEFDFQNEIDIVVKEGYPSDIIPFYAISIKANLIILGTQGDNSITNKIFGSVTKKIIQDSSIPVLAIPSDVNAAIFQHKYLFAIDNKAVYSNKAFEIVVRLCKKLDKKLDLLHIINSDKPADLSFDPEINNHLPGIIDKAHIIQNHKDVLDSIEDFVKNKQVSLLIMLRRRHSLFNRMIFKSNTDRTVLNTKTPLFIIPEE